MRVSIVVLPLLLGVALTVRNADRGAPEREAANASLRAAETFAQIGDERERARALFDEIGRVLQHPRCSNCHPSGDRPFQGDDGQPHQPKVVRGNAGWGAPGMRCTTCHTTENVEVSPDFSVPGHSNWHLPPSAMGWTGRSLSEICEQIKDPARNGSLTLDELAHHMAEDPLVGWAWDPGAGREPPPGTQEELGELTRAWVDAGAHCPGG